MLHSSLLDIREMYTAVQYLIRSMYKTVQFDIEYDIFTSSSPRSYTDQWIMNTSALPGRLVSWYV